MHNNIFTHGLTNKHSHTHWVPSVGTPVSLRVSIVVHLAVLCSTLCSQHASHLKPDTYGPVACWSDTPLLLWSHCRCWGHSTWLTVMRSLYKLSLFDSKVMNMPCFLCWELVMSWRAASNSQCFLLRQYIDRWKLGVSNTRWCNLPFRSLLSVANWLNCINREACSVGQRRAGMRDRKGMREGSSWCEGVSPHNGGKIWSGIIKSNNQQRWSCELLFLPQPASILGCDITHSPVSINNSRNMMQGHGLHTFDGLVLFQSLIKSLLIAQKVGFSAITCAQLS